MTNLSDSVKDNVLICTDSLSKKAVIAPMFYETPICTVITYLWIKTT